MSAQNATNDAMQVASAHRLAARGASATARYVFDACKLRRSFTLPLPTAVEISRKISCSATAFDGLVRLEMVNSPGQLGHNFERKTPYRKANRHLPSVPWLPRITRKRPACQDRHSSSFRSVHARLPRRDHQDRTAGRQEGNATPPRENLRRTSGCFVYLAIPTMGAGSSRSA